MADNKQIGIKFGVSGGGSLSGDTGQNILNQLNDIIKSINARGLNVKIKSDSDRLLTDAALTTRREVDSILKSMQDQTAQIIKTLGNEFTYPLKSEFEDLIKLAEQFSSATSGTQGGGIATGLENEIKSLQKAYEAFDSALKLGLEAGYTPQADDGTNVIRKRIYDITKSLKQAIESLRSESGAFQSVKEDLQEQMSLALVPTQDSGSQVETAESVGSAWGSILDSLKIKAEEVRTSMGSVDDELMSDLRRVKGEATDLQIVEPIQTELSRVKEETKSLDIFSSLKSDLEDLIKRSSSLFSGLREGYVNPSIGRLRSDLESLLQAYQRLETALRTGKGVDEATADFKRLSNTVQDSMAAMSSEMDKFELARENIKRVSTGTLAGSMGSGELEADQLKQLEYLDTLIAKFEKLRTSSNFNVRGVFDGFNDQIQAAIIGIQGIMLNIGAPDFPSERYVAAKSSIEETYNALAAAEKKYQGFSRIAEAAQKQLSNSMDSTTTASVELEHSLEIMRNAAQAYFDAMNNPDSHPIQMSELSVTLDQSAQAVIESTKALKEQNAVYSDLIDLRLKFNALQADGNLSKGGVFDGFNEQVDKARFGVEQLIREMSMKGNTVSSADVDVATASYERLSQAQSDNATYAKITSDAQATLSKNMLQETPAAKSLASVMMELKAATDNYFKAVSNPNIETGQVEAARRVFEMFAQSAISATQILQNQDAQLADQLNVRKIAINFRALYERNEALIKRVPELNKKCQQLSTTLFEGSMSAEEAKQKSLEMEQTLSALGLTSENTAARIRGLYRHVLEYFSATTVILALKKALTDVYGNVKEVDTSLTQLQIVTQDGGREMEASYERAADSAKKLGVAISNVVDSQTTYARLGYTTGDSALLAEQTAMLTKVGDIDQSVAENAVTAIAKAYDVGADKMSTAMDKMVKVGNNFPISAAELAEGMNNAGSMLASAGNSLEQSMALLTGSNATVQNISKAATGLRTIVARLRNTKTELDDLGESQTIAEYEQLVTTLTDANVRLTDQNGELRSSYDMLRDLSKEWENLGSMEQAAISEAVAGTRQQNIFASLMNNFDEAEGALKATSDAEGTMAESYDYYLNSIEGHLGKVQASWKALSNDLLNSDLVNGFLSLANGVLSFADALNKVRALIPAIVGAGTSLAGIKIFDLTKLDFSQSFIKNIQAGTMWKDNLGELAKSLSKFQGDAPQIAGAIEEFQVAASKGSEAQKAFTDQISKSNPMLAQFMTSCDNASDVTLGKYVLKLIAAKVATIGLQLATAALQAVISWGLSAIITGAITAISNWVHHAERLAEKAEEARDNIESLTSTLKNNIDTINDAGDSYAKLSQFVDQLSGKNISLSDEDYQEFINSSNEIAEVLPQLVSYYDSNGNAVLNLNGNYETITATLQEYITTLRDAANADIAEEMPDVFDNANEETKKLSKRIEYLKNMLEFPTTVFDDASKLDQFEIYLKAVNVEYEKLTNADGTITVKVNQNDILSQIDNLEYKISQKWASLGAALSSKLQTSWDYVSMSEDIQAVVQQVIGSLDWNTLDFSSWEDAEEWITRTLLPVFGGENGDLIATGIFNLQTEMNGGNLTVSEFEEKLKAIITLLGDNEEIIKSVKILFSADDPSKFFNNTSNKVSGDQAEINSFFGDFTLDELDKFKDWFDDFWTDSEENGVVSITGLQDAWEAYYDTVLDGASDTVESLEEIEKAAKDLTDTIGDLSSENSTYINAVDEFDKTGKLSLDTLKDIVGQYPELADAVSDVMTGLVSEQDLIDQMSQSYLADAMNFAYAQVQKQIANGATVDQIQNAWISALGSLGISYDNNRVSYDAMLNSVMYDNTYAVNTVAAQWNALFSKLSTAQKQIANSYRDQAEIIANTFKGQLSQFPAAAQAYNQYMNMYYSAIAVANGFATRISSVGASKVGSGGGGGGGSSSSKTTDSVNDAYKNAVDALKNQIDYYEWQAKAAEEAFNFSTAFENWQSALTAYKSIISASQSEVNRLISAGYDYSSNELKDALGEYMDAVDAVKDIYSDMLDKMLDQYKDFTDALSDFNMFDKAGQYERGLIESQLAYLEDAYKHDLITTEKYTEDKLSLLNDLYDEYKDYVDDASEAVQASLDKEIEKLEAEQEALESRRDTYDSMVNAINDLIDQQSNSLRDENDALDRQIQLQKALQALEDAKNQRTKRIFREGIGYVWEADDEAIKSAQETYDDLVAEIKNKKAEDNLNKLKDAINAVSEAYDKASDKAAAAAIMGADWSERWGAAIADINAGNANSDDVLASLLSELQRYSAEYSDMSRELDDNADGSIASQIKQLDDLSDKWGDLADALETSVDQYSGLMDYISEFESASYEDRLDMLSDFQTNAVSALDTIRDKALETAKAMSLVGSKDLSELLGLTPSSATTPETSTTPSTSTPVTSTPAASTANTSYNYLSGLGTMRYGSKGGSVTQLQQALIGAGFSSYLGRYGADGIFGSSTLSAVKAFQRAAGLSVDGIVGPLTLAKLIKKLSTGSYAKGGVVDYTGIAQVHGGNAAEMILNNADVSKLYDYIHNTPNLVSEMLSRTLKKVPSINAGNTSNSATTNVNVSIGDLYEVNDADRLAREISQRLPNLVLQRLN